MLFRWLDYVLATVAIILLIAFFRRAKKSDLPLPPGPKGLPLLKNLLDLPSTREYETYTEWGKIYGDVIFVQALNKKILILNSVKAAVDLLDKKSAIYSDRPYVPMIHDPDLNNSTYSLTLKQYTDSWKRHRRLFTRHINPTSVKREFTPRQLRTAYALLDLLLKSSGELGDTILLAHSMTIFGIAYGYDPIGTEDVLVKLAERSTELNGESVRFKYLVNLIPILKYIPGWLPGVRFKALSKETRDVQSEMVERGYQSALQAISSGNQAPSFIQKALQDRSEEEDPQYLKEIKFVAGEMYEAGVGTSTVLLHFLILKLILNPHVLKRGQDELDNILGAPDSPSFRFPTFEDRPSLPYINAIVKEVIRCCPPVPSGVPHCLIEDDEYRGWRIPKGSIVMPNAWGMNNDKTVYSSPYEFRPERFLEEGSKKAEPDPTSTFGFGRRICPGRFLGESSVWIETACILATCNLAPAKDADGKDIDIRYAQTPVPDFVVHPQPFPCSITARTQRVQEMIGEMAQYNKATME